MENVSFLILSSDDLMSLLEAGVHVDDPSFVVDPEAIFSEDMFYSSQYGTIHRRPNSSARASRTAAEREADRDRERTREREALRRERDRWLGNIHAGGLDCGAPSNVPKQPPQDKLSSQSFSADPVSVADLLQWWPPDLVRNKIMSRFITDNMIHGNQKIAFQNIKYKTNTNIFLRSSSY